MWIVANALLGFHIALFVALVIGVVLAALGWMGRRPAAARIFWPVLAVVVAWQFMPGCALTDLEEWLRHRTDPTWERQTTILQAAVRTLTGIAVPRASNTLLTIFLGGLGVYAFVRYHLKGFVSDFTPSVGRWKARRADSSGK